MLHGIAGSTASWAPLVTALARAHRVVAIDLPGFGRSEALAGEVRTGRLAEVVAETLDVLGIARAAVVGQSLGGIVALQLALDRPELVSSLVVISAGYAFAIPPEDDPARQGHVPGTLRLLAPKSLADAAALLGLVLDDSARAANPAAIEEVVRAHAASAPTCNALVASFGRREDALDGRLDRVRAPTLVLAGASDRLTPPSLSKRLCASIPGARLAVVGHAGHAPVAERPADVQALVQAHLGVGPV
jgi:pimeloyl-ACP methyl ester carboxylesterase